MRTFWLALSFLALSVCASAQEAQLALQYFRDGEFEKAAALYEKLHKTQPDNDYFFDQYLESLLMLERYEAAEDVVKKALKKQPKNVGLYVAYGNVLERQFKDIEARAQYERAIKKLPADRFAITKLASAFTRLTKYDYAIQAYERGAELLNDRDIFAYNLAELYRRKGDVAKMIENYLNSLDANPGRLNSIKSIFQRYLSPEDYQELQLQLYARLQKNRDAVHYTELLSWVFIQKKDYFGALRQVKALDRRLDENGARIFQLGRIAANDGDYDAAIEAFDYIVEEKGLASTFYLEAKREALRARRHKLVEGYAYSHEDLLQLEQAYESFLDEFGRNRITAPIIAELADLEALYLNDLDKAIRLLEEMIDFPGIDPRIQARAKLSLGDFYLMKGERWEATLLYSQVDKDFTEDLLGHEARFRNAKLAYYFGDFEWAQAQFKVLKASTSKLIANDALEMSIFIMDNLGLDTTDRSLKLYADADLLTFQNRFDEAFRKLDTLRMQFPDHALQDDVLYLKGRLYKKLQQYEKAAEMFAKVVEDHPDEIRADNALFEWAELLEHQLANPDKAMELYEKLFIEYSGSTFAVEARKRFRRLRGDNI